MCCGASSFGLSFVRNRDLFNELEHMVEEDRRLHASLGDSRFLFAERQWELDRLHQKHADRLKAIIAEYGWPGHSLVGNEGATYAWMLAQHATCDIEFQRQALELIKSAAARHQAPISHAAYLEDLIRVSEGRPQLYGTQFELDHNGLMSPLPIEDASRVNERRRAVGLEKLEKQLRVVREHGVSMAANAQR